jgi:hypothetical protein
VVSGTTGLLPAPPMTAGRALPPGHPPRAEQGRAAAVGQVGPPVAYEVEEAAPDAGAWAQAAATQQLPASTVTHAGAPPSGSEPTGGMLSASGTGFFVAPDDVPIPEEPTPMDVCPPPGPPQQPANASTVLLLNRSLALHARRSAKKANVGAPGGGDRASAHAASGGASGGAGDKENAGGGAPGRAPPPMPGPAPSPATVRRVLGFLGAQRRPGGRLLIPAGAGGRGAPGDARSGVGGMR